MKTLVLALGMACIAPQAQASYLESCKFTASVAEVMSVATLNASVQRYTRLGKLAITAAVDQGSHSSAACSRKVGKETLLVLDEAQELEAGQVLTLDYFYVNSYGPQGVVFSERWTIVGGERFVCPAPGTTVNCMPTIGDEAPRSACGSELRAKITEQCPDVMFLD
jgi:hypothetical protein